MASWVFCVSQPTIGCGDAYCSWKLHEFANVTLRRSYVYAVNPLGDCGCNSSRQCTILLRLTSPSCLCKASKSIFAYFLSKLCQNDRQFWKPMSWPLRQRHGQLWKPLSLCDVATSTLSRKFTILLRLTSPSRLCKAITIAFAPFRLTCRQRDIQLWKPMSFCAVAASTLSIYFVTAVAILLDQLQFYCGNFTDYSWISFAAFLS